MDTEIVDTNSTCQELLQESEVNPDNFFDSIVTGDESWIHHYDLLSQLEAKVWKRLGEQTPTGLRQERSAGKIMMIIFWDKDGVLLTEYLPRGTTIDGPCYASIIQRLRSVTVGKRCAKLAVECCFFMTTPPFISATLFKLLFDRLASLNFIIPAYSPDIAPSDYHLFSNLNNFVRLKNFSSMEWQISNFHLF